MPLPKKRLWIGAVAVIVLGLLFWLYGKGPTGPFEGNKAPDFSLVTLRDEPITLHEFKGRPLMVNFWATWCPPCRREMPRIQALYDERGDQFNLAAVSDEKATTVEDYLKEFDYTFPFYLDRDRTMHKAYLIQAIPTTIFIDAKGIVRARHTGEMTRSQMEEYLDRIVQP